MVTLKVASILFCVLLVGAVVGGVFAYTMWAGEISWQYEQVNYDFTVAGEQHIDYGIVVGSAIKTANYTVTNTGNAPITVLASCTPSDNSTISASWDKTTADIPVDGSATFDLTLVISGAGSCNVNFAKAPD